MRFPAIEKTWPRLDEGYLAFRSAGGVPVRFRLLNLTQSWEVCAPGSRALRSADSHAQERAEREGSEEETKWLT